MKYTINDRKNFPSSTGIYCIYFKNSNSNKVYIGSASRKNVKRYDSGFFDRWSSHITRLRKNDSSEGKKIKNAYNKYGQENMVFEILEECSPEDCLVKEQYYIDKFDSYNNGYNSRPISSNNKGFKQSEEQKQKIRNKYKIIRDSYFLDIKRLYEQGKTTYEISNLLKISRSLITTIFKENGIKPRKLKDYVKKKIFQFDIKGNFIKEWDSISECSKKLNLNTHGIQLVLHNKCKHFKGFYFNFDKLNQEDVIKNINIFIIKSKNRKYFNINQIDLNGNEIKIWRDVKEIIDFYNFSNTKGICESLKTGKTYKGYYWKI